jgi:hypothetical protein
MKKIITITLGVATLMLSGCTTVATIPNMHYNISNANFTKDTKSGKACVSKILNFDVDVSVRAAALKGGVNKVTYVEVEDSLFQVCTVVYGE